MPERPEPPHQERSYRVWIEKHESGWVTVRAPSEDVAQDRAQNVADCDRWYPEHSHSTPCKVEEI